VHFGWHEQRGAGAGTSRRRHAAQTPPVNRLQALIQALQPASRPDNQVSGLSGSGITERWIFATSAEPVLIVDAARRSIVEANLAAAELLGRPRSELIGQAFPRGLDRASAARVQDLLARLVVTPCDDPVTMRAFDGGRELAMTASLFSSADGSYYLVRLSSVGHQPATAADLPRAPTLSLIEEATVAVVLTDLMLKVEYANPAFSMLAGLSDEDSPRGRSLTRWLDLTADDLRCIQAQGAAREATLTIDTTLRAGNHTTRPVSACVVVVPDGELPCCAFLIDADPA